MLVCFLFYLGFKMKKRVGELEEFEFETIQEGRDLQITLTISGWLTKEKLSRYLKTRSGRTQYLLFHY